MAEEKYRIDEEERQNLMISLQKTVVRIVAQQYPQLERLAKAQVPLLADTDYREQLLVNLTTAHLRCLSSTCIKLAMLMTLGRCCRLYPKKEPDTWIEMMRINDLQPSLFDCDHDGFGTVFDVQAVEDFLDVALDSVFAEVELGGDLAAGKPLGNEAQDDELLGAEQVRGGNWLAGGGTAAQLREHAGGNLGVDGRFSARNGPNGALEVEALNVFDEKTARASLDTLRDQRFIGKRSEDHDGGLWIARAGQATEFDAVRTGQANINQGDVWSLAFDQFQRLLRAGRFSNNLEICLSDENGF